MHESAHLRSLPSGLRITRYGFRGDLRVQSMINLNGTPLNPDDDSVAFLGPIGESTGANATGQSFALTTGC